ncbi:putative indole-3-pyruvate monooxygenase YUCCA10 [Morella rubra]|uniref:Flavin-containing monooxygenase n=1 Tax=Morella rubra TaxID=262757 RepID=A0A6A1VFI3_9ROSI|nr:putative indole-3-pyruvate monooxygenase YUCCA10 [Morella rubra]
MEEVVVIVGAGPSGLATSACLSYLSISHVILEREDCYASLWKKRSYDRMHIHLAKEFCSLPYVPHSSTTPIFMSKDIFVSYIDNYVSKFNMNIRYYCSVESSCYDVTEGKWRIEVKNILSGEMEAYIAEFLVVATGANSESFIPALSGLNTFPGEIVHASEYKSGSRYQDKEVLVVGCGNSGMEISYDISDFGAHTIIVIRSPFHVLTKEMVYCGMSMLKYLPVKMVDPIINMLAGLFYGDLSKYGIVRPVKGPFQLKEEKGRSPVIDVGTVGKIIAGDIKVFPSIAKIDGSTVEFENGAQKRFDAIVFATGYRSKAASWLKDYQYIVNGDGMPKNDYPNHWKGQCGVYCAGLLQRGLFGISEDARAIANDIAKVIQDRKKEALPMLHNV